jgi:hypothetical protein
MGLTRDAFALTDEELKRLNAVIEETVTAYFKAAPHEDPLDGMSVIFTFVPGFGRSIEVDIAGRRIDVDP